MTTYPVIVLVMAVAGLGGYLFWNFLTGERNKPTLIGVHLLAGMATLEVTMMIVRGAPDGTQAQYSAYTNALFLALAVALLTGLLAPVVGRQYRVAGKALLYGHAGAATLASGLLLWWTTKV